MKNLTNIEKSTIRRGEYVGYAGGAWRITHTSSSFGNWQARHQQNPRVPLLYGFTLGELNTKLADRNNAASTCVHCGVSMNPKRAPLPTASGTARSFPLRYCIDCERMLPLRDVIAAT